MPGQSPPDVNIPIFIVLLFMVRCLCCKVMIFPSLCFYVSGILCAHSVISLAWPWPGIRPNRQKHTALRAKTLYAIANTIVCHGQKHCMLLPIPLYANGGSIVCQSRTAGSPVKKQGWMPSHPPHHFICHPACHRRGRGSFHLSQRHFLHRAADLYDIDTVAKAADTAVRAAVHARSPG